MGLFHRAREYLGVLVLQTDTKTLARRPDGDIRAHDTGADHVHVLDTVRPRLAVALELLAQQKHVDQIAAGAKKSGKIRDKDLFLVHDRTNAIRFTLNRAKKGDTVLLLGKGHEKTIERADGEHPWDEIAAARQALKVLK